MTQRLVKPVFWPVLVLSCIALAVMTFFLIGGMVSSRAEDYFISALLGFVLFMAARTVVRNVIEPPYMAIGMMFAVIALAGVALWVMNHALTQSAHVDFGAFEGHRLHGALAEMPRGVRFLGTYRGWADYLTTAGFNMQGRLYIYLHRAIYLSYGIIAGGVFVVLQAAVCALLFIKTKPEIKPFRH